MKTRCQRMKQGSRALVPHRAASAIHGRRVQNENRPSESPIDLESAFLSYLYGINATHGERTLVMQLLGLDAEKLHDKQHKEPDSNINFYSERYRAFHQQWGVDLDTFYSTPSTCLTACNREKQFHGIAVPYVASDRSSPISCSSAIPESTLEDETAADIPDICLDLLEADDRLEDLFAVFPELDGPSQN